MPFIIKENFTERFFADLYAMVKKYGVIYYTSDNVRYRDEEPAKLRVSEALALRQVVKYIKVTEDNFPTNADELEKMFSGYVEPKTEEVCKEKSFVSEEDAAKALEELKAKKDSDSISEPNGEKEYEKPSVEVKTENTKAKRTRKSKK